jgi:hypothetical protein
MEWNGRDGKGMDIDLREVETSSVDVFATNLSASTQVFQYWQITMNHPRAKFDSKRERLIIKALQLGYRIDELKQAIDGCKNTPFNMGKNDRNQVYDDITLVLRDAEHIERFMSNASRNETQSSCMSSDDIMAGVI